VSARYKGAAVLFLGVPLLLLLGWIAGFAWFVRVSTTTPQPPPEADGIVALTGGAERVETALRLLAQGHARLLLISGVGGAAEFSELAHRAGVDPSLRDRVTLGRSAASTRGNAAETAAWAHDNGVRSLIVVTAGYHMPRALAELSRTLPEVTLYPYAVVSPTLRGGQDIARFRLLAGEYTKWLGAQIGLSALGSQNFEPGETRSSRELKPAEEQRGG
jgi:uncharacterized SAM-binding protein YcdF (DUF218 family)